MTLRQLWTMAHARRERQRALALDVRFTIWTQQKFDAEAFLKRGHYATYQVQALPDTEAIRQAKADLEAERLMHERARHGG